MRCGHAYHPKCFYEWSPNGDRPCAICRNPARPTVSEYVDASKKHANQGNWEFTQGAIERALKVANKLEEPIVIKVFDDVQNAWIESISQNMKVSHKKK